MGKLIPFLFIALDGKSAVAHLRLRIPGHKLRGSWFIFALIWIVAGWFDLFGMSMANGAHIAGLAVGLAMAFVDSLNARKRK